MVSKSIFRDPGPLSWRTFVMPVLLLLAATLIPFFGLGGYGACRSGAYKICAILLLGRCALCVVAIGGGIVLVHAAKLTWWMLVERKPLEALRNLIIELLIWVMVIEIGLVMTAIYFVIKD